MHFLQINLYIVPHHFFQNCSRHLYSKLCPSVPNGFLKIVWISNFFNINWIVFEIWPKYGRTIVLCSSKISLCVPIGNYFTIVKFIYFQVQKTNSIVSFHFMGKLNSEVIFIESIYNYLHLIQRYTQLSIIDITCRRDKGKTDPNLSKTDLSKSSMTISASIREITEPIGVPNFCL